MTIKELIAKRYTGFKWHLGELIKTLSNQPSFYSSKRIERLILFLNANIMLDYCIVWLMEKDKMDYLGAVAIYTAQMVYAGYQMAKSSKEAKEFLEKQNTPSKDSAGS